MRFKKTISLGFQDSKKGKIICGHDEGPLQNGLRAHLDRQILKEECLDFDGSL